MTRPTSEYEARLTARRQAVVVDEKREGQAGTARVLTFVGLLVVGYLVFGPPQITGWWLLLPLALFIGSVVWHRRVLADLGRAQRAVAHYRRCLDRVADKWAGHGPNGQEFANPEHPYSGDLDLFGRGSLFQLLCTARTPMGREALAQLLLNPASVEVVGRRQQAIQELTDQLDLREQLAVVDASELTTVAPNDLIDWATAPPKLTDWLRPWIAVALAVQTVGALVGWILELVGPLPFIVGLLLHGVLLWTIRKEFKDLGQHGEKALGDMELLAGVLAILETQKFQSPLLVDIQNRLSGEAKPPSRAIGQLAGLVAMYENATRNQFFAPIAFIFGMHIHICYAVERWRRTYGPKIPGWLRSTGEAEALLSLANYAYERPDNVWPQVVSDGPKLEAEALGHPLLPAEKCVRNDITLGAEPALLLISGSNMSGKSTMLRSVGLGIVMALSGAPVRAKKLTVSPIQVGTAMRVQDSIQQGQSHFYAEIRRIRSIVDLADAKLPLCFLLDEILHGTNSHDRLMGARAVIKTLLEKGSLGMVTTHDLTLADIADSLGPRARNVHFEDQLVDGQMSFDYKMRPGVVPKSNALALMRILGLEV